MSLLEPTPAADSESDLKGFDRYLRQRRFAKAAQWIKPGSHVLDIGSSDLALFAACPDRARTGVGIDTDPQHHAVRDGVELRHGTFPEAVREGETFDAIVMLAVAEHIQPEQLRDWSARIPQILRPGGTVVITVPSPLVDPILHVLIKLHVVAGIAAHEHYGFRPAWVPALFLSPQLQLVHRRKFQLGLNNLFVFQRV